MEEIRYTRGLKASTVTQALRRTIKSQDYCCICKRYLSKDKLHIEHTIPVCLGGDINKFTIMCVECHKVKDRVDKFLIALFKRAKLLYKCGFNQYESPISSKELSYLYFECFSYISEKRDIKE